jgi:hypothetical protein
MAQTEYGGEIRFLFYAQMPEVQRAVQMACEQKDSVLGLVRQVGATFFALG